jgi:hypothetical protein
MAELWVKFHGGLCTGSKAALSRATRFIYLELCIDARKEGRVQPDGSAFVTLSPKGTYAQAVRALLGGSAMEIVRALPALEAEGMIRMETIVDDSGVSRRVVRIVKFRQYADRDEGGARSKLAPSSHQAPIKLVASSDQAPIKLEKTSNNNATLEALEERRGDKKRVEEIAPPGRAGMVFEGLQLAADLFDGENVSAAAKRIEAKLGFDKQADSLDRRVVGSECATHARTQAGKYPNATASQRLSWAEQKADWILRDVRVGRFKPTQQRGAGGAASHAGDFDGANAVREVEEADRKAAAAHRARGRGGDAPLSAIIPKVGT